MTYTIVGVIGHIDHGKTSLVAALTGVDTDTHPEEKRRGITIDLGFAAFTDGDERYALIDAPGHQKYIGNLLAGVSGIDVGLLVVACDQGIQEQTLEHVSILSALHVEKLVVAVSKIDLVDEAARRGVVSGRYAAIGTTIERRKSKHVPMNIDGATAVVYAELGFPPTLCRGLFVLSRSIGILAHAWEQIQQGGRNKGPVPRAYLWRYTGPPKRHIKGSI